MANDKTIRVCFGQSMGGETQPADNDAIGLFLCLKNGPKSLHRSTCFENRVRCEAGRHSWILRELTPV